MARSQVQNQKFRSTGDVDIDTGREPVQLGWYEFSAGFCRGKDVLDVGCGMGEGLKLLSQAAKTARGIDLDERLRKPNVDILNIKVVEAKSVDLITCIDVIEHVEEDLDFVFELFRVARQEVLVSTPNWTVSRCQWPYHIREYMPHQLYSIFRPFGVVELYKGTFDGKSRYKVKHLWAYSMLNRLNAFPLTSFLTRVFNHFLPVSARIHSSLYVRVIIGTAS